MTPYSFASSALLQTCIHAQNLACLDLDIRGRALKSRRRPMDQDARIGQRRTFDHGSTSEQDRTHAGSHADARSGYLWADEMHRDVDGQTGVDLPPRTVDVHLYLTILILLREVEQLRDNQVGYDVVNRRAQKYDAVLEQQRKMS